MKTIFAFAAVTALAIAGAASAESFTGAYKSEPATVLTAPGSSPARKITPVIEDDVAGPIAAKIAAR